MNISSAHKLRGVAAGLLVAGLGLATLTGCGGGGSSPNTTQTGDTAQATGPIKIGVNYEQSGAVATYGQDSVDGINMAIDEVNAAGGVNGRQVQLITYDTKSDPAEALTLATKLMTQDKVLAILGPATSGSFTATIPAANQYKVPVISGSATADTVTVDSSGNVQPFAFRTCFSDSLQGTAAANYALSTLNAKNAVIIKDNSSDYGKGLADNFTAAFTAGGGNIVDQEAYVSGDTDFNAILTRVRGMQFDMIYLPGYYNEAGLIIKAARDLGINQPVVGPDGFDSPDLLSLAGASALNNVFFTNHYSSLDQSDKVQSFITAFKAKFNKEPSAFNALGYDTANFVVDAIKRASASGDLTGETVQAALAATKDFPAVTGTFSVDANHNAVKQIIMISLKDGVQDTAVPVTTG